MYSDIEKSWKQIRKAVSKNAQHCLQKLGNSESAFTDNGPWAGPGRETK